MNIKIKKLTNDYKISDFDCGNIDLNEFLQKEAILYSKRRLSVTYLVEIDNNIAAFFSLSNDKIAIPDSDKSTWRKIKSLFPHSKHRSDYPAVKIGRLGIALQYQKKHLGSDLLCFIKEMFIENNRTGCAFVTVDALNEAIPFYQKNGFLFLNKDDTMGNSKETCLLYYNLSELI